MLKSTIGNCRQFLFIAGILASFNTIQAQISIEINAVADLEFSMAGSKSHYYYNGIDADHTDPRIGISGLNLISKVHINSQWSLNSRLLLERDKGKKLEKLILPELNIAWLSKKRRYGITLGSFSRPFGIYGSQILSINRDFISLPLAYTYHNNISGKIGFVQGLGDNVKIPVDGEIEWGLSNIYYGGYSSGALFSWNIKPSKVNWKIALTTGAANQPLSISNPINYALISRIKFQPTYYWEQGISVSYGTFLQSSEFSYQVNNLQSFSQSILGLDYRLGYQYLEISGEILGTWNFVPEFDEAQRMIDSQNNHYSVAGNIDLKYEPKWIQGSFIAYRIDYLKFSETADHNQAWDNSVLNHSLAMGYRLNEYVLFRLLLSTQSTANKDWNNHQRVFRFVMTAHY